MDETAVALAGAGAVAENALRAYLSVRGVREPCLLIVGWEAQSAAAVGRARAVTKRVLRGQHGVALGRVPGEAWVKGRFAGPRQRDALLDIGVCVETLETATYWSGLTKLREAVRSALLRSLPSRAIVMCHISHAYETGASLYFTVITVRDKDDPIGQWEAAKAAASEAIANHHNGTITHHHGVGTLHAPYLESEIGELGMEVLEAVKRTLDPTNVMNPGKLIPKQ
jgi:alkyldihydroxyacetonephosphate synthase